MNPQPVQPLRIQNRLIGSGQPALIVAELSGNHLGSLERARSIIDAAADAGADAVKLQTYTADTLTIPCDKPWFRAGTEGSIWDGMTEYELYRSAETPFEWMAPLFEHTASRGLICFSSPFDPTAVALLQSLDAPAYKIASYEITDIPLIRLCARTGRPVILATGIARPSDIRLAVDAIRAEGNDQIILLKCTSAYPTPYSAVNLRMMPGLGAEYDCLFGLSDHTPGWTVPVMAATLGACMIEKHLTLRRADGGPDGSFSLEPEEFASLVQEVRHAEAALGNAEYRLTPAQEHERAVGARSLFITADIPAGNPLTQDNIRSIRPGQGLPPVRYEEILGKKATRDLSYGEPLREGDFA